MKKLLNWKLVTGLSAAITIMLLFFVLRSDFLALPDSGLSRGIVLGEISVPTGYDDYYAQHYTSLTKDQLLYVVIASESGLDLHVYDEQLTIKKKHHFENIKGFNRLQASFSGETLMVTGFNNDSSTLQTVGINLVNDTATVEDQFVMPKTRAFVLGPNFQIYEHQDALYMRTLGQSYPIGSSQYLETLNYTIGKDNSIWVAFTEYVDGQYQLNLIHLSPSFALLETKTPYYQFGAGGSSKPHELDLKIIDDRLHLLSVIKDHKAGVNTAYWLKSPLSNLNAVDFKYFNAYTYSLEPLLTGGDGKAPQLVLSSKTSIGRVEIGSNGTFQNLIGLSEDLSEVKALTKSTRPSLSPEMNYLNGYTYLSYVQINQGNAKIMVSSDQPELVNQSLHSSLTENLNLLMTTLTTFLPLLYVSMIVEIYVLTPVLVVVILISMFKITWAERNAGKLLTAAIGIHLCTKLFFISRYIFNGSEVFSNFPSFMDSPFKFLGWATLMTIASLYAFILYKKEKPSQHYLLHYLVFNLIDILLFTMLYAPYYLLV